MNIASERSVFHWDSLIAIVVFSLSHISLFRVLFKMVYTKKSVLQQHEIYLFDVSAQCGEQSPVKFIRSSVNVTMVEKNGPDEREMCLLARFAKLIWRTRCPQMLLGCGNMAAAEGRTCRLKMYSIRVNYHHHYYSVLHRNDRTRQ